MSPLIFTAKGGKPTIKIYNREKVPVVVMEMGDAYQVSSPFVLPLASLRSEERKCLRLFAVVVVMETMYYACVPSFPSMRATVSKFVE